MNDSSLKNAFYGIISESLRTGDPTAAEKTEKLIEWRAKTSSGSGEIGGDDAL